jgi:hypothetical protein
MTAQQVLMRARAARIRLEARGETLHVEAPAGTVTPELREQLTAAKPHLLEILWRLAAMRQLPLDAAHAVPYARASARGGPGHCFSCGDPLEHPESYGRCPPCDVALEVFYATRHASDQVETVSW